MSDINEGENKMLDGSAIPESTMEQIRAASGQESMAQLHLNVQFTHQDLANMIQALVMLTAHYRQHAMIMSDAGSMQAAQQFAALANSSLALIRKLNGADVREGEPIGGTN